jgi:hypothetical protein
MKNFRIIYPLFIAPLFLLSSCYKNTSTSGGSINAGLTLSKSTVKIGEPLIATTSGSTVTSGITWSTPSNGQVWPSSHTDSATFVFTHAGSYQIAAYIPNSTTTMGPLTEDSSTATVIVTDSVYGDTSTVHCDVILVKTLSPDDQINLTPISYSDTGLIFIAHTQDLYTSSPILNCGGNIPPDNSIFECDFNSAFEYVCIGSPTPTPASGIVSFTSLTNGTFSLLFKLNGITYQGSVTATDQNCTITWNYSSGVTISPLTIQKQ